MENSVKSACPCMEYCPLEGTLKLIGGKWKLRIICALSGETATRYNELKRKVTGITNTMLASSLKELEKDGLICRRQYQEMPVRVEYSLTETTHGLMPILMQLAQWGMKVDKESDNSN